MKFGYKPAFTYGAEEIACEFNVACGGFLRKIITAESE